MNTIDIAKGENNAVHNARRDLIFVRDYAVDVEVGAFQEERGTTQALKFGVVAELSGTIHEDDDVDSILSYDNLISAIDQSLAAGRADLLETLAERIAQYVLATDLVAETTVSIEKLDRISGTLGIEITRSRADMAHQVGVKHAEYAIELVGARPKDGARMSAECARVLIASATGQAERQLNDDWARFNADLLLLDLGAWSLADGLNDVPVAATKTELEWALAQNRTVIWAPSRMILNTAVQDHPATLNPEDLAQWLGLHLKGTVSTTSIGTPVELESGAPQKLALAE